MTQRKLLRRVLVANRGEIAVRIVRSCRSLGIETVLAVADADAGALPARLADAAIRIAPPAEGAPPAASYLDVGAVIGAAQAAGADAVHPGYGFLAESPRLARACAAAGLVFIGPTAGQLEAAGDKLAARASAAAAGLPVLPGGAVGRPAEAESLAERIGWPVLIKAAAGGGGRGLRPVHRAADLGAAAERAIAEAAAAFGDPRVYLERYVQSGRHVEVQLLGDGERVIHLGDRDCSVQRRYQKLLEEAPAPRLGDGLRAEIRQAAVAFGELLGYRGLGTVEFLVDAGRGRFWFLEMNARIQVEHPVTEAICGLDLVAEQIAVAEGRPLRLAQDDVRLAGHAIECRINAEDPADGFRPSPGTVTRAVFPAGPGIRVDTHLQAGSAVPAGYDSLLAKVIASGRDRAEALDRLRRALARCEIAGVATTIPLHAALTARPEFARGGVDTGYLARFLGGAVADIQLVDTSIRDGNQSLWGATGLKTAHILQIAPIMDRVGFRALDFSSSTHMGVSVRTHQENPWELIRLAHATVPNTPLQFIGSGLRFISWQPAHPDLIQLVYDRLVIAGMSRFVILDPMHDMEAVLRTARMLRRAGAGETIAALTYTISAVHDDDFYAGLAGQMAACPDIDRVYVKDPAGLLTPERARTLIPAIRARLGAAKPLELHSHCTIGLSPLTCLAAADLGVSALHVACGSLANGTSLPNAQRVLANLRELGHTVDVDDRLLAVVADYFTRLARAESLPAGTPQEYDASLLRHQVAGGVMTTTRRQLDELGLGDRFDAVMEEVSRVRAELGYPIMVTPFPQMVCGQALYNVIGAERYANVPDQVIRYVLGRFGRPTAPVDPDVADRILSRPRARELTAEPPPSAPAELRKRFPAGISDEEFLLRATMPAGEVDAMLAAGPARRHYNPDLKPVLDLLAGLAERPGVSGVVVDKPGFRLELRAGQPEGPARA